MMALLAFSGLMLIINDPKKKIIIYHCVKSVQIRSFFCFFSGRYFPIFSTNKGKHGPEKTLYLDTFHPVYMSRELGKDIN